MRGFKLISILFISLLFIGCEPPTYQVYKRSLHELARWYAEERNSMFVELPLASLKDYYVQIFGSYEIGLRPHGSGYELRVFNGGKVLETYRLSGLYLYRNITNYEQRLFLEVQISFGLGWRPRFALAEIFIENDSIRIAPVAFDIEKIMNKTEISFSRRFYRDGLFRSARDIVEIEIPRSFSAPLIFNNLLSSTSSNGVVGNIGNASPSVQGLRKLVDTVMRAGYNLPANSMQLGLSCKTVFRF